jgi:quercetin dioxygenase-like cupin family protein
MQSTNGTLEVVGPRDGKQVQIGGMGVRFMVGAERGAGFSLVEHPIAPRALAAPMHSHAHEDEYSYVLEGEVGIQVGDEVTVAKPGDMVFKPRGVPHAFWNAGDAPARLLEIISPAPFANYFAELEPLFMRPEGFDSVEMLVEREGLAPVGG